MDQYDRPHARRRDDQWRDRSGCAVVEGDRQLTLFSKLSICRLARKGRRKRTIPDSRGTGGELMNFSTRDRRALILLGAGAIAILILRFTVFGERQVTVVAAQDSIPAAERRLARVRQLAATVPGKEKLLKDLQAEAAR